MWIGKKSWIALLNSTEFFRANGGHALLILFNLRSIFVKHGCKSVKSVFKIQLKAFKGNAKKQKKSKK
ncbi:hypothetical protein EXS88_04500 [Helicobacter pylori]|nr:hypothetical protein [Helicobacter pylori]